MYIYTIYKCVYTVETDTIYTYIYICIYVYIYIYNNIQHVHACMHSSIHASVRPSIHPSIHPSIQHKYIHTYVRTYICTIQTIPQPHVSSLTHNGNEGIGILGSCASAGRLLTFDFDVIRISCITGADSSTAVTACFFFYFRWVLHHPERWQTWQTYPWITINLIRNRWYKLSQIGGSLLGFYSHSGFRMFELSGGEDPDSYDWSEELNELVKRNNCIQNKVFLPFP